MDTASEDRSPAGLGDGITVDAVRSELKRVLDSRPFQNAERLRHFLGSAVELVLHGRGPELKEYFVATEILGRPTSFDPRVDSVVRVEARRLRAKLEEYYSTEGRLDPIAIELPKGGYAPGFRRRLIEEAERPRPPRRQYWKWVLLAAAAAACILVATRYLQPRPAVQSIAVLPFLKLSDDPQIAYFADGLVEEITSALAQAGNLRVAARTSAFRFQSKGLNLAQVGHELKVQAVVEGSVRRDGDRIRVNAQMVDTASGYHLWSAAYDREARNTLGLPGEVASHIQAAISGKAPSARRRSLPSLEARDAYWKGLYFYKKNTPDGYRHSVGLFEDAIRHSPDYADAHAWLAAAAAQLAFHQWEAPQRMAPKALAAAIRALQLDPNLGQAHGALGVLAYAFDHDWSAAESAFRRAIELEPQSASLHHWFALALITRGRFEEAISEVKQAVELDPVTYVADHALGVAYYSSRRYDEACAAARSALKTDPKHYGSRALLGSCLAAKGDHAAAVAELERAMNLEEPRAFILGRLGYSYAMLGRRSDALRMLQELENPRPGLVGWQRVYLAQIYAGLGDREKAIATLQQSFREGDTDMLFTMHDYLWDPLRSDPRMAELRHELGLP
jgi:TolB-like protein/Flp pilus assembly protein TadD